MDKLGKRLLAVVLVVLLVCGSAGTLGAVPAAAAQSGDDGTTNWDFIVPVTHQTTVPAGYKAIRTATELNNIRNEIITSGSTYRYILMDNIDLSSWANWEPIQSAVNATVELDGNGYVIRGLNINIVGTSEPVYAGLFGRGIGLLALTIINTGLVNCNINVSGTARVCMVGGFAASANTLENCFVAGTSTISVETTAPYQSGGASSQSGQIYVGGLVANCVIGYTDPTAKQSYNTATIQASAALVYVGGLIGYTGAATQSYNKGNVTGTALSIEGSSYVGFVAAGGIMGTENGGILRCFNNGNITTDGISTAASLYAGGITGSGTASYCYNTGNISAANTSSSFAGGLIGTTTVYTSSVYECFNVGAISGSITGGIAGRFFSINNISNCYFIDTQASMGSVTGTSPNIINVSALTDTQMRQQSSFVGYNFSNVWKMPAGGGYPILQWQGGGTTGVKLPDPAGNIQQRIAQLQSVLADGAYFSANGEACGHGQFSTCDNCLLRLTMTQYLGYEQSVAVGVSVDAWTCVAFARFAFFYIFGVTGWQVGAFKNACIPTTYAERLPFSEARLGDIVVWTTDGESGHYAIYLGQVDGENRYYQSNSDSGSGATNRIRYNTPYDALGAPSHVIRAKNYDVINGVVIRTLTLNPNGGSVSPTSHTGTQGQTYTLPTPTRSGHTFTGWTLSGGGSLSGSTYTFGASNGTVTANWTANSNPNPNPPPEPKPTKYVGLFGLNTKYESTPLNWILFFLLGFIWMWF